MSHLTVLGQVGKAYKSDATEKMRFRGLVLTMVASSMTE